MKKERHGHAGVGTKSAEYKTWAAMRSRCNNKNTDYYHCYGGIGVKVCERWNKFSNFLADMGPKPSPKHSIDRINSKGNYEPSNCRWATNDEQAANKKTSTKLTVNGETKTIAEWTKLKGYGRTLIAHRIRLYGWTAEAAVLTPPNVKGKRHNLAKYPKGSK